MEWPALKRLVQKQYDGLSIEVQGYFDDLHSGKIHQKGGQPDINSLYTSTLRFLTQSCSHLSDACAPLEPEVIKAIEYCCHGYSQLCQLMYMDEVKVASGLKIVLYLVSKLHVKASCSTMTALSSCILTALKTVSSPEMNDYLCDLITKSYSFIWNAAITVERQVQISPLDVFQLRLLSLRILAQLPSKIESCFEKVGLALSVLERHMRQQSSNKAGRSSDTDTQQSQRGSSGNKCKTTQTARKECASKSRCETKIDDGLISGGPSQPEYSAFSMILGALEEFLSRGEVQPVSFVRFVIAIWDFLVSVKLQQHAFELHENLQGETACGAMKQKMATTLKCMWNIYDIVECLCEEKAQPKNSSISLLLKNMLDWCKEQRSRTHKHMQPVTVELFHWFTKQIKNRPIRDDFFEGMSDCILLLDVLEEIQSLFVEAADGLVSEEGRCGSPGQEWREKVTKTHLDVHRCWLVLYHRAVVEKSSSEDSAAMAGLKGRAVNQLEAYSAAINAAAYSPAMEHNERYTLGSLSVRLGHVFYNKSEDEQAIPFYSTSCQQLALWCQADPDKLSSRIKETSLLKIHNCLSHGLHRTGRIDDAMATIMEAITLCGLETDQDLSTLIKTWLKLKKSAIREGGESMDKRLARVLVDSSQCPVDMVHHYLCVEFIWMLKGPHLWPAETAVLKQLTDISPAEADRDMYQLLLLQCDVFANYPLHTSREEIEGKLSSISSRYPAHRIMQTEICLIRFCLLVKDKLDKPVSELSEEDLTVGPPTMDKHSKMIGEEEKELVRGALRAWRLSDCDERRDDSGDLRREIAGRMLVEMLMMVADTLLACREFILQLEVLTVALHLLKDNLMDSSRLTDVSAALLDALTGLGVEGLPHGMIDSLCAAGKDSEGEWLPDKGVENLLLSLISLYLKTGKMTEAHQLMNELRDKDLKGELGSLHRGRYNRLMGECLRVSPMWCRNDGHVLTFAHSAYRFHFSLFSRVNTDDSVRPMSQDSSESLWRKLVELLETTLSLGRTYRHIGDVKRVKCYLKEGLALSRKFGLLKWSTIFGLELTELMTDTESLPPLVEILKYTYTNLSQVEPPTTRLSPVIKHKTAPNRKLKSSTSPTTSSLAEDFRKSYEEEHDILCGMSRMETEDGAHFWLKMRGYHKVEEAKRVEVNKDIGELAVYILSWIKSLSRHPVSCWCLACTDPETQLLALSLAKTAIRVIHANSSADQHLVQFFEKVLRGFHRTDLTERMSELVQSMGLVDKPDMVKRGDWQLMLCVAELSLLLAESSLRHHNISQAFAHTQIGFTAMKHTPQHLPQVCLMKSQLVHAETICMHHALRGQKQQRSGHWTDTWCWLTEAQLDVQVRRKLDQLRIKPPLKTNTSKTSLEPAGDTGQGAGCHDNKGTNLPKTGSGNNAVSSAGSPTKQSSPGVPLDMKDGKCVKLTQPVGAVSPATGSASFTQSVATAHTAMDEEKVKVSKTTLRKPVAQSKKKPSKQTTEVRSARVSFEDGEQEEEGSDLALFTNKSLATQLFSDKLHLDKKTSSSFQTPLALKLDSQEKPSSMIRQTLSFSAHLSDSEGEFQPSTPKATPRAIARSRRGHGQSKEMDTSPKMPKPAKSARASRTVTKTERTTTGLQNGLVETLEQKFATLALSASHSQFDHTPAPEKTRHTAKISKKGSTGGRKSPVEDALSVEAIKQGLASLDLSREADNIPPHINIVLEDPVEDKVEVQIQEETVLAKPKGGRGRGKKYVENTDVENAGLKVMSGKGKQVKALSPRGNVPLEGEAPRDSVKQTKITLPLDDTAADTQTSSKGLKSQMKRGKGEELKEKPVQKPRQRLTERVVKETAAPSKTASKTSGRSVRKPKDTEKPPAEPLVRKSATTRGTRGKTKQFVEGVELEREVVRGGDEPEDSHSGAGVFDFVDSGDENEAPQTGKQKGRKVKQTKTPAARKVGGKGTKPPPSKTPAAKTESTSSKHAASKKKSVVQTSKSATVAVSCKENQSGLDPGTDQTNTLADSTNMCVKQAPPANTMTSFRSKLDSIETVRMGDITCALNAQQSKCVSCDPQACASDKPAATNCGRRRCDMRSESGEDTTVRHQHSLLAYLRSQGKGQEMDEREETAGGLPLNDLLAMSQSKKGREDALHRIQSRLLESMSLIQHFPHVSLFSESSKMLAQLKLDQAEDQWEIAATLGEAAAVSLRHQYLAHYQKQIRLCQTGDKDKDTHSLSAFKDNFQDLLFPWDLHKYTQVVQSLPQGWTVCQFSVVDTLGHPVLLLTRLTCDQEPLTVELPGFSDEKGQAIYFSFKDILKANDEAQKIQENGLWWHHRALLDAKLANTLEGMEKHWLGSWKGMLVGQTSDVNHNSAVAAAARKLVGVVHRCLGVKCSEGKARQAVELLKHTRDLPTILNSVLQLDDVSDNAAFLAAVTSEVLEVMLKFTEPDLPVVLILDKHLVNLPMEQLNILRRQQVTRVPSLSLLHLLLKQHSGSQKGIHGNRPCVMQDGVDPKSVFYVLNPDGDLQKSQEFLKTAFESFEGWQGVAGAVPTKEQYEHALTHHDLFVYSGHGSGCKYFSSEDLLKVRCRAVPLLFGCGSVRLDVHPKLDPDAYFYSYLLSGSPCVLGNLWDITDRDIDAFALQIFQLWLQEKAPQSRLSLASLVQQARSVCRMQWLNGGAPVLYGLPVPLV